MTHTHPEHDEYYLIKHLWPLSCRHMSLYKKIKRQVILLSSQQRTMYKGICAPRVKIKCL